MRQPIKVVDHFVGGRVETLEESGKGHHPQDGNMGLAQYRRGRAKEITNNLSHKSQPTAGCSLE
jgi:hypothetical protein